MPPKQSSPAFSLREKKHGHTLTKAIQDFLVYMREQLDASPSTLTGYRCDLRSLQNFLENYCHLGPAPVVTRINSYHLNRYFLYLRNSRGNSEATIRRKYSVLSSFFRFLRLHPAYNISSCLLPVPSPVKVTLSRTLPSIRPLDQASCQKILQTIPKESPFPARDLALFRLLLECGPTAAELRQLEVDDVNLAGAFIVLRGGRRLRPRVWPLSAATVQALSAYLAVRNPRVPTAALFLNSRGLPLTPKGMQFLLHRTLKAAGLAHLSLQHLRVTALALLQESGADPATLAALAGVGPKSTLLRSGPHPRLRRLMQRHPLR